MYNGNHRTFSKFSNSCTGKQNNYESLEFWPKLVTVKVAIAGTCDGEDGDDLL